LHLAGLHDISPNILKVRQLIASKEIYLTRKYKVDKEDAEEQRAYTVLKAPLPRITLYCTR
jgi:hypothetical protein